MEDYTEWPQAFADLRIANSYINEGVHLFENDQTEMTTKNLLIWGQAAGGFLVQVYTMFKDNPGYKSLNEFMSPEDLRILRENIDFLRNTVITALKSSSIEDLPQQTVDERRLAQDVMRYNKDSIAAWMELTERIDNLIPHDA